MKRVTSFLCFSLSVPATIALVLTAHPARLYAEAGVPWPSCTDPQFDTCAGKAVGASCDADGAPGFCAQTYCSNPEAGLFSSFDAGVCTPYQPCVTQMQIDDCTGKATNSPCGDGGQGTCVDTYCNYLYDGPANVRACFYSGPQQDAAPDAAAAEEAGGSADGGGGSPGPDGASSGGSSGAGSGGAAPSSSKGGCTAGASDSPSPAPIAALGLLVGGAALMRLRTNRARPRR
jgi:hypothetical protein